MLAFLVLLGVLIGGYLTRQGAGQLAFLASGLQEALAPVQARLSGAITALGQRVNFLIHYWQIDSENRRLRQEIVRLQLELASLREARRENELLRELLNMNPPPKYRAVSATIIGRSPRQWASQLIIDSGQDRAVDVGAVVVGTGGVVGRVVAATPSSARVLLITDPASAVGGLVERTGDLVLVEGMPGTAPGLKARTLSPHAELKQGDVIVTSGLGGIFPKGLPLGTVVDVKVDPYGLATTATVQPAADFGRMEYLLVLVPVTAARKPAGKSEDARQAPARAGGGRASSPASQSAGRGQNPGSPQSGEKKDPAAAEPAAPPATGGQPTGNVAASEPQPESMAGVEAESESGEMQPGGNDNGTAAAGPSTDAGP